MEQAAFPCTWCKKLFVKNYKAQKYCSLGCSIRNNPINKARSEQDIEKYFSIIGSHNPKLIWKKNVKNHKNYLDYKEEKSIIDMLFDKFRKYGGVAEWL